MNEDQRAFVRSAIAITSLIAGADGKLREAEVETLHVFLKETFELFWASSVDAVEGLRENVASWSAEGHDELMEVIAEGARFSEKMRRTLNALASHVAWSDDEVVGAEADLLPAIAEALGLEPVEEPDSDYLYGTSGAAVDIGVFTARLRYDEDKHGAGLAAEFAQARDEWVASGNNPEDPRYRRACELISRFYRSRFLEPQAHPSFGWTFTFSFDDGSSETGDAAETPVPVTHVHQVEAAFGGQPRLVSLSVVSVDFREDPSSEPLGSDERLCLSPDVALVAVFRGHVGRRFANAQQLADWVRAHHELVAGRFTMELKPRALRMSDAEGPDGDADSVSSVSWEGGDIEVRVSVEPSRAAFVDRLTQDVHASRHSSEEDVPDASDQAPDSDPGSLPPGEGLVADDADVLPKEATDKATETIERLLASLAAIETADEAMEAGIAAYKTGDFSEALRCYRSAAISDDVAALHNIGQMYAFGEGVEVNWHEAIRWWSASADKGSDVAQLKAAGTLYHGFGGVAVDLDQALRYAEMASERGGHEANELARRVRCRLRAETGSAPPEQESINAEDEATDAGSSDPEDLSRYAIPYSDVVSMHEQLLADVRSKTGLAAGQRGKSIARLLDAIDPRMSAEADLSDLGGSLDLEALRSWDKEADTLGNMPQNFLTEPYTGGLLGLGETAQAIQLLAVAYVIVPSFPGDTDAERMAQSLMVSLSERDFFYQMRSEKVIWPDTERVVFLSLVRLFERTLSVATSRAEETESPGTSNSVRLTAAAESLSILMKTVTSAEERANVWSARTRYAAIRPMLGASLPAEVALVWAVNLDMMIEHHAARGDFGNLSRWWLELETVRSFYPGSLEIAREQARSMAHVCAAVDSVSDNIDGSDVLTEEFSHLLKMQASYLLAAAEVLSRWAQKDLNIAARLGVALSVLARNAAPLSRQGQADALDLLPRIWRVALDLNEAGCLSALTARETFDIGALVRRTFEGREKPQWFGGVIEWMASYVDLNREHPDAHVLASIVAALDAPDEVTDLSPEASQRTEKAQCGGVSAHTEGKSARRPSLAAVPTEDELKAAQEEAHDAARSLAEDKVSAETALARMSAYVDSARLASELLPQLHRSTLAEALSTRAMTAWFLEDSDTARSDFLECVGLGQAVFAQAAEGGEVSINANIYTAYMTGLCGLAVIELNAGRPGEALRLCETYDAYREKVPDAESMLEFIEKQKLWCHGRSLISLGKTEEEARSILMRPLRQKHRELNIGIRSMLDTLAASSSETPS
jgi:tellurite resistance protein/tetratricopeptide (TPR) repeat protein